jgi:TM2 domain
MTITDQDLIDIEQRVEAESKSRVAAYALWLFTGLFGGHRFYTGRIGTGFAMMGLTLSGIGTIASIIWWVLDYFKLGSVLEADREIHRDRISREVLESTRAIESQFQAMPEVELESLIARDLSRR